MKIKIISILFMGVLCCSGAIDTSKPTLSNRDAETIAAAIYRLEGGAKTKYPYGIRSIDTGGDVNKAKRICINTIKNNFKRWQNTNKSIDYLTFLANRYCPKSADPVGNKNWIKNIHEFTK